LNQQIQAETGKALPPAVLDEAFSRMQVTYDPLHSALTTAAQQAFDDGFLGRQMPDLFGTLRPDAPQSGSGGEGKKGYSMSTNAT
jgi:hypothetical protein